MPQAPDYIQAPYGYREDGTFKGEGYYGKIPRVDKPWMFSTELSATGDLKDANGKPVLYPLLAPGLSRQQIDSLMSDGPVSDEIYNLAEAFAAQRLKEGKSPFARYGEKPFPLPSNQPAGLPTMPQAPDSMQPTNPSQHPGMGYAEQPNMFWKALEGVVNGLRNYQGAQANPSLFHEPTMTAASAVGPAMQGGMDVMSDPRNAWMGLGPVAMMTRPMGFGAEALRRYKLLGGTPETLNKTLTNRMVQSDSRNLVVNNFRRGTDLAAPGKGPLSYMTNSEQQAHALNQAGTIFDIAGQGERKYGKNAGASRPLSDRERLINLHEKYNDVIDSGTTGQAAYDAVGRQVARMLDMPGFGNARPQYGPEPTFMPPVPNQAQRYADRMMSPEMENIRRQLGGQ